MEAEQKERERQEGWWGTIKSPMDRLLGSANASASSLLSRQGWDEMQARVVKVTELSERKYLTISWWLLNIGWKDVKDKVETAVAEVFSRYVGLLTTPIERTLLTTHAPYFVECLSNPS